MLDDYGVYDPTDYDLEDARADARAQQRETAEQEHSNG